MLISLHIRADSVDPQLFGWGIQIVQRADGHDPVTLPAHITLQPMSYVIPLQHDQWMPTKQQQMNCHALLIKQLHSTLTGLAGLSDHLSMAQKRKLCVFMYDAYEHAALETILLQAALSDDADVNKLAQDCSLTLLQGGGALKLNAASDALGTSQQADSISHAPGTSTKDYAGYSAVQIEALVQNSGEAQAFVQQCIEHLSSEDPSMMLKRGVRGRMVSIDCVKQALMINASRAALELPVNSAVDAVITAVETCVQAEKDELYRRKCELLRPRVALIKPAVKQHMLLSAAGFYEFEDVAVCLETPELKDAMQIKSRAANLERIFSYWHKRDYNKVSHNSSRCVIFLSRYAVHDQA